MMKSGDAPLKNHYETSTTSRQMLRLSIALILPPSSFTFASITAYARRNQISQVVSSPHVTLDCYDLSPTLLFLLAFHSLSVPVS